MAQKAEIDASQAASIYEACQTAIGTLESELKLKRAQPYARAIKLQIDDYRGLQGFVKGAFPGIGQ